MPCRTGQSLLVVGQPAKPTCARFSSPKTSIDKLHPDTPPPPRAAQYLSVHADPKTLREGVSFVIDFSTRRDISKLPKQGNERLIQSFYQAIPQRPQVIMIAGCSLPTRAFVNASIKLASIFVKQKILQRIHFVTRDAAVQHLPAGAAPAYLGGDGGGVESYEGWVKDRLEKLTVPEL